MKQVSEELLFGLFDHLPNMFHMELADQLLGQNQTVPIHSVAYQRDQTQQRIAGSDPTDETHPRADEMNPKVASRAWQTIYNPHLIDTPE